MVLIKRQTILLGRDPNYIPAGTTKKHINKSLYKRKTLIAEFHNAFIIKQKFTALGNSFIAIMIAFQ